MATIKRRGNGWYVQVRRAGFEPLYKTFKTKSEASAWSRQQEAKIDQREAPTDLRSLRSVSLGDLLKRYRNEITPKKRSAESERLRLDKILRAPLSSLSMANLTPAAFASYRDIRLLEVAPATVRRELALLRHAINTAMREWGVSLQVNPLASVSLPIVSNARDRRFKRGELDRLQSVLNGTRPNHVAAIVLLAIETALRRGEILNLRWSHIDTERQVAHIPLTKTGKPRTIPLTQEAIRILGGVERSKDDRVFIMSPNALRLAWERIRKRAGLADFHFHDLRHESISRFVEMGLSIAEVALISGHKDPRMLFRYTHLRPEDLAAKLATFSHQQAA